MTAAELFERYNVRAYRYFLRATGSPDVAQDLTQDLFVRVMRNVRRHDADPEPGWIFHIARHLILDYRRTHRSSAVPLSEAQTLSVRPNQVVAFSLSEALGLLSDGEREVFLLREVVGLSYAEVAAMCETKTETVRSRLYHARGRLRYLLGGRLAADANKRRNEDG